MDRNRLISSLRVWVTWSLSARRAWIEITNFGPASLFDLVALRKESVDRNAKIMIVSSGSKPSLSARRAWIEIKYVVKDSDFAGCRSPQGERG